jgi:hypothetical protein
MCATGRGWSNFYLNLIDWLFKLLVIFLFSSHYKIIFSNYLKIIRRYHFWVYHNFDEANTCMDKLTNR